MAEAIDLRGTQGAVVLPGGTVVQHYPPANTDDTAMNQRADDNGDRAMHDQVYKHTDQLADIRARVTIIEAALAEIKAMLQRQQQQFLLALTVVMVTAAIIFGVSYAGQ